MNNWNEENISKSNRQRRLAAEKGRQLVNLPILNVERELPRKVRDKKFNQLIKRASKKS